MASRRVRARRRPSLPPQPGRTDQMLVIIAVGCSGLARTTTTPLGLGRDGRTPLGLGPNDGRPPGEPRRRALPRGVRPSFGPPRLGSHECGPIRGAERVQNSCWENGFGPRSKPRIRPQPTTAVIRRRRQPDASPDADTVPGTEAHTAAGPDADLRARTYAGLRARTDAGLRAQTAAARTAAPGRPDGREAVRGSVHRRVHSAGHAPAGRHRRFCCVAARASIRGSLGTLRPRSQTGAHGARQGADRYPARRSPVQE